jgi:hypothetical protein
VGEGGDGGGVKAGTMMGKEVRSPTFPLLMLNMQPSPNIAYHIVYRYEGDPSLPANLKPIREGE